MESQSAHFPLVPLLNKPPSCRRQRRPVPTPGKVKLWSQGKVINMRMNGVTTQDVLPQLDPITCEHEKGWDRMNACDT
jgi:hypothetical protein